MSRRGQAVFLFNLLQDVNVLRPLVLLATRDWHAPSLLLVSDKFIERDLQGVWQAELQALVHDAGASLAVYDSEYSAMQALSDGSGMIFAGSESDLPAHSHTHNVFRVAPPTYLRVTLQHGYECVGFLQNRDQRKAHGRHIGFAADVVCGWCDPERMHSVAPAERDKYCWTGPSALLDAPPSAPRRSDLGIVCENLHSARMKVSGDFKASFMDSFNGLCAYLAQQGRGVALRPHPGGQYVLRQGVELSANVVLENRPIYQVDLRAFRYGISAPSSVLVDMVLAGLPVAVWQDEDEIIDASNYAGLARVTSLDEMIAFERDARVRPAVFERQRQAFLDQSGLLYRPEEVRHRFGTLLSAGLGAR